MEKEESKKAQPDYESSQDAFGRMEQEGQEEELPKDLPQVSTVRVVVIAAVLLVLLIGLFLMGYIPHRHRVAKLATESKKVQDAKPSVEVISPKRADKPAPLILPGTALPLQQTSLYPRANGYLKKLNVDIGDRVKEGQVLAEIDTPEVDAQMAAAKANVQQSQANVVRAQTDYELAQATLTRYKGLSQTGGVTQQQLDEKQSAFNQARGALEGAKAAVASANAEVDRLKALQGYEQVTAPFEGIVTARTFDVGALLNPSNTTQNQQLFEVDRTDTLRVFINVPQVYATAIRTGHSAKFVVRNFPNRVFEGNVARSAGALDPRTRTLRLQVNFPNADGTLLAGMYGQVTLEIPRETPLMTIPTSALVFNAEGLRVVTIDGENKAHFQKITVGRDFGTEVEVSQGLKGPEKIVANPGERLADGVQVDITPAKDEGRSNQGGGRNGQDAVGAQPPAKQASVK